MTGLKITEEPIENLAEYSSVSISFEVRAILDARVVRGGLGGIILAERPVESPYVKDYDAIDGEGPARWARNWDISNWCIISAFLGGTRAGGCMVAYDTAGVEKLEGRKDIAALWDLRVRPDLRGRGIGTALFKAAAQWARNKGCSVLKVETQNINLPACRLYAKEGCILGVMNRYAYRECPGEVELVWYKQL